MNPRSVSQGLRLVLKDERAEAAEWQRHLDNPNAQTRARLFDRFKAFAQALSHEEWRRIGHLGLDRADTDQLAYEALLGAIDRFDPLRGVSFQSYAAKRIKGAIRNALAKATEANAAHSAARRIERERVRSIKDTVDIETAKPLDALRELAVSIATGFLISEGSESRVEAVAESEPSAYDAIAWRQFIAELDARIDELPQREAMILTYHYRGEIQFSEIARILGVSRGRVSQLHGQALKRLRSTLSKYQ